MGILNFQNAKLRDFKTIKLYNGKPSDLKLFTRGPYEKIFVFYQITSHYQISNSQPRIKNGLLRSRVRIDVRPMENDSTRLYKNGDISVVITCS